MGLQWGTVSTGCTSRRSRKQQPVGPPSPAVGLNPPPPTARQEGQRVLDVPGGAWGDGPFAAFLAAKVSATLFDAAKGFTVHKFAFGQSNPTFLLKAGGGTRVVVRMKPVGAAIPGACACVRVWRGCVAAACRRPATGVS